MKSTLTLLGLMACPPPHPKPDASSPNEHWKNRQACQETARTVDTLNALTAQLRGEMGPVVAKRMNEWQRDAGVELTANSLEVDIATPAGGVSLSPMEPPHSLSLWITGNTGTGGQYCEEEPQTEDALRCNFELNANGTRMNYLRIDYRKTLNHGERVDNPCFYHELSFGYPDNEENKRYPLTGILECANQISGETIWEFMDGPSTENHCEEGKEPLLKSYNDLIKAARKHQERVTYAHWDEIRFAQPECLSDAPLEDLASAYNQTRWSIVDTGSATAFRMGPEGLLVTAAHTILRDIDACQEDQICAFKPPTEVTIMREGSGGTIEYERAIAHPIGYNLGTHSKQNFDMGFLLLEESVAPLPALHPHPGRQPRGDTKRKAIQAIDRYFEKDYALQPGQTPTVTIGGKGNEGWKVSSGLFVGYQSVPEQVFPGLGPYVYSHIREKVERGCLGRGQSGSPTMTWTPEGTPQVVSVHISRIDDQETTYGKGTSINVITASIEQLEKEEPIAARRAALPKLPEAW